MVDPSRRLAITGYWVEPKRPTFWLHSLCMHFWLLLTTWHCLSDCGIVRIWWFGSHQTHSKSKQHLSPFDHREVWTSNRHLRSSIIFSPFTTLHTCWSCHNHVVPTSHSASFKGHWVTDWDMGTRFRCHQGGWQVSSKRVRLLETEISKNAIQHDYSDCIELVRIKCVPLTKSLIAAVHWVGDQCSWLHQDIVFNLSMQPALSSQMICWRNLAWWSKFALLAMGMGN